MLPHLYHPLTLPMISFIQVADPTKVKVVNREHAEGEAKLLDSTVGCVVLLLPVSPARAKSELEASVENLFDEGGSTKQGDSTASGGHDGASLRILDMAVEDTTIGNVIAKRLRRQCKKRRAITDASGSSHPPKKLKGDHRTSSEAATGGKSLSILKELLVISILNVEAGVEAVATLPLVTSSVSAMPKRESGVPNDSVTRLNLRTIGLFKRFVISSDSSHHSSTNAAEVGIDSFIRYVAPLLVMTEAVITTNIASILSVPALETSTKVISLVHASMFHDFDSTGTVRPNAAGKSCSPSVKDVEIQNLKAQLLLKEAEAAEAAHLRIQRNVALENLLGAALTWWNGHVRTLGHDAAYAMTWGTLKKKLTDKYCSKGKITKLEIELWNLRVRGNDVATYMQRFQEPALMCTKFLADETENINKYISGLPDNIHGNVISVRPKTLDDAIELANDLMDQKLCTYAERQNDNKSKADDLSRNNQQPHKK
ncbi:reverse transcriptase domain-containing protein [Tanacetum coccineum]